MSPLTRLVSRAWYGIRHLTTPLRSIHLPVESPRKVGTLESPLQLTRPHGWHSGALGRLSLCMARGVINILISDKQKAVPMENPVFGFLSVISRWTPNLVNRPVSQLRLNDETPVFPMVLYLSLAHKAIGTNHKQRPQAVE